MKKHLKWIIPLVVMSGLVAYFIVKHKLDAKTLQFTYTELKKGDIESLVTSTGTLKAINTVEVGTQISGTITKIHVDYNDKVRAGQLLAEMDLKLLRTNLLIAQANLSVSEAKLQQAKEEYQRNKALFDNKVVPQQQFSSSKYAYEQALSANKAAEASVNNIQVSMGYAHITSPISGTITERTVEEGQTVAASFATPTMFIIAEDLSKMQILADVDESDIGYITESMQVRFTVQAYPQIKFYGMVRQIRLQPTTINNVVNYQVVVDVENKGGKLLPGMTTNLEFIVNTAKNTLLINNSALRFRPNDQMLMEVKSVLLTNSKKLPDSLQQKFDKAINNEETYTPAAFKSQLPPPFDGFFHQDANGKLDFDFVEIGIKSGMESEIKRFLDDTPMQEGDRAINSIKSKNTKNDG